MCCYYVYSYSCESTKLVTFVKVYNSLKRCKERLRRCIVNRRAREPYAQWCVRRTLLIFRRAVYSVVQSYLINLFFICSNSSSEITPSLFKSANFLNSSESDSFDCNCSVFCTFPSLKLLKELFIAEVIFL